MTAPLSGLYREQTHVIRTYVNSIDGQWTSLTDFKFFISIHIMPNDRLTKTKSDEHNIISSSSRMSP